MRSGDSEPGGYRTQAADTDPAAERYLFTRLRALPPWRKAQMLSAATRAAAELAMVGLRERHPEESADVLRKRLAALLVGRDAAIALFGWDPEKQGW